MVREAVLDRIKVCLNGSRKPGDHPGLPVAPDQLAVAARDAVAAGAQAIHMHPRDARGAESLHPGDIAAAVAAVRAACPGVPIGVSTGLWIAGRDPWARLAQVVGWERIADRPDFASVNVHEPGFAELARLLASFGIGTEAGVWSEDDADALARSAVPVLRVLIEIMDVPEDRAPVAADAVIARLDRNEVHAPRLLHGEGVSCWPLVAHAGRLGLPTRIGLEDTLTGPSGEPVPDNATLVRLATSRS